MREIKKEPDWKVLRRVHPLALERFCEPDHDVLRG
jgi:hypothetical protein